MDGSDPCQLQSDALAESINQVNLIMDSLQTAMELLASRTDALELCRLENQGGGSEGGGPEGP
jgi:hypothetical protein